jgi:hypothetical protein
MINRRNVPAYANESYRERAWIVLPSVQFSGRGVVTVIV